MRSSLLVASCHCTSQKVVGCRTRWNRISRPADVGWKTRTEEVTQKEGAEREESAKNKMIVHALDK
jgi:hypothetical protein